MSSIYNPLVPTGTVNLDIDYQNLQNNFSQLDTSFGFDHFKYSDQTSNNGFHNTVTTPAYQNPSATYQNVPPTTSTNPVMYAFQPLSGVNGTPTTNLGVLQYSRGPSNAVPTPVTSLQSPSSPLTINNAATSLIFNFSGLTLAWGKVIGVSAPSTFAPIIIESDAVFNSSGALNLANIATSSQIQFTISGTNLYIKNTSGGTLSNIYWTFQLYRTS